MVKYYYYIFLSRIEDNTLRTFLTSFVSESKNGVTVSDSKEVTKIHQKNIIQTVAKGLNLTEWILTLNSWKNATKSILEQAHLILENS